MKWYKVFDTEDQALTHIRDNKPVLIILKGIKICFSYFQGKFYATDNRCPHHTAALHEGQVNYIGEIVCPLHHYRFSLKDGRESGGRTGDLHTFPVKNEGQGIYIGMPE